MGWMTFRILQLIPWLPQPTLQEVWKMRDSSLDLRTVYFQILPQHPILILEKVSSSREPSYWFNLNILPDLQGMLTPSLDIVESQIKYVMLLLALPGVVAWTLNSWFGEEFYTGSSGKTKEMSCHILLPSGVLSQDRVTFVLQRDGWLLWVSVSILKDTVYFST
jgi:hypothetical protein